MEESSQQGFESVMDISKICLAAKTMFLANCVIKCFIIKQIQTLKESEPMIMGNCLLAKIMYAWEGRGTQRNISTHRRYSIEDKDLVVEDNSDIDTDWPKHKSDNRLL